MGMLKYTDKTVVISEELTITDETESINVKESLKKFQFRPVLIYDKGAKLQIEGNIVKSDSVNGLSTSRKSTSTSGVFDNDEWAITDCNLSVFSSIRFVCVRNGSNHNATFEFDVPLDYAVENDAHYVASGQSSAFGNRDRWLVVQAGVSGDKTKIGIGSMFSMYGATPTTITDIYVVRIYGIPGGTVNINDVSIPEGGSTIVTPSAKYELQLSDEGILSCVKTKDGETSEGFVISEEGIVSLS